MGLPSLPERLCRAIAPVTLAFPFVQQRRVRDCRGGWSITVGCDAGAPLTDRCLLKSANP
jgi:hypothetical protein